jgi:hypothetical protein
MPKTTAPATAHEQALDLLRHQQAREGFIPGAPPWVDPEDLAVDAQVAQHLRCGRCSRGRTMQCHPYHNPLTAVYRSICVCQRCGATEEM